MSDNHIWDVAVAGGGPVGATAANLLARQGLDVIVLERNRAVPSAPRAGSIDHETHRVFQSLGLLGELDESIVVRHQYEFVNAENETLIDARYPKGPTPHGAAAFMFIWQPDFEHALRRKLRTMPNARMVLGAEVQRVTQMSDKAIVTASTEEGDSFDVMARYVLGCDGGSSTVRKLIGAELDDYECDERWLAIDAKVLGDIEVPEAIQFCDPSRPTGVFKMPKGHARWLFMILPGEDPDIVREDLYEELLEPWATTADLDIVRRIVYTFHALVSQRWREGRVFLLGDAAHQTPPNLGQGLCSGVRDAMNLSWKLAEYLSGNVPEAVLDTYQQERDPHMREVVQKSVELGRMLCTTDVEEASKRDKRLIAKRKEGEGDIGRDRVLPGLEGGVIDTSNGSGELFIQPEVGALGDKRLLDDFLSSHGFFVVANAPIPWEGVQQDNRLLWKSVGGCELVLTDDSFPPSTEPHRVRVRDLHGFLGDWLDGHEADVVVVRPDKYVFGTSVLQTFDDLLSRLRLKLLDS